MKELIQESETERKVEVEMWNWVTPGNCSQTFTCDAAAEKPETKEQLDLHRESMSFFIAHPL